MYKQYHTPAYTTVHVHVHVYVATDVQCISATVQMIDRTNYTYMYMYSVHVYAQYLVRTANSYCNAFTCHI